MVIRDSANPLVQGKVIYVQPQMLAYASLKYDPDFGQSIGFSTGDGADSDSDDGDDVSEIGNTVSLRGSHHQRTARQRADLPTLSPATPNLSKVIDHSFATYSNSRSVSKMVAASSAHIYTVNQRGRRTLRYVHWVRHGRHMTKQTLCWRAVKDALISSGLVDGDFGSNSGYAFQARQNLLDEGFRDLLADPRTRAVMRNPDMAPKGAVLVYQDSRGTSMVVHSRHGSSHKMLPGHVEIKTASSGVGGYISINKQQRAAYGEFAQGRRRLVAVMVQDT
jgi:hypothetical protein